VNPLERSLETDDSIIDEQFIRSSDRKFGRWLGTALIVALLGATILGVAAEITLIHLNTTRTQARAVRSDMLSLGALLNTIDDAESSQRGYLLTGNQALLQKYKAAAVAYPDQYQHVVDMLDDDDKATLQALHSKIGHQMSSLQNVLNIDHQSGFDAARAALQADQSRFPAAGVDTSIRDLIASQQARFNVLSAGVSSLNAQVSGIVGVLIAFELILVGVVLWVVIRDQAPRVFAAQELSSQNEDLRSERDDLNSTNDQLEASLKRFESLFRGVPVACYFTGPDGEILEWNSASESLFGFTTNDVRERTIYDTIVRPAGLPKVQSMSDGVMSGQSFDNVEWVCRTREGKEMEVMSNLMPLVGENGHPIGVMTATIDMTERKAVERLKSEFVSTVSHELRTPLTSIRGALGLVCSGAVGQLPEQVKRLCSIANNNTERLVRLINDLLDIEKIEEGGIVFQQVPFSVKELTLNAINAMKGYSQEYNVEIIADLAKDDITITSDPDRLTQVFNNLISNALKFSGSGTAVVVKTVLFQSSVRVSVRDSGPGIPEDFRSRVFEKFAQADSADTRKAGGTGLGLSISRAIMTRLNGRIWFETGNLGSTFFFEVPTDSKEGNRPLDASTKALVCVGDKNFVNTILVLLTQNGIQGHVSYTAQHAKQTLGQEQYDLLIMDAALPDQDGLELLRELRSQKSTERLPIVVVASSNPHGLESIGGDPIVDWIKKPLDSSRFIDSVMHAVTQKTS